MSATVDELVDWIREEQEDLWLKLRFDVSRAIDGAWSIGAWRTAERIVGAARLVGPTPAGEVPWALLAGGVYAALLERDGIPLPDDYPATSADWAKLIALMEGDDTPRADLLARYARTVAAIKIERAEA